MKRPLYLLLALLFIFGCNEPLVIDPDTGFEIYTIDEGAHSSIVRSELFEGTGALITVRFDESAQYSTQLASNQADINKLSGFSHCAQHHRSESARFGWRWFNDELQILAYVYNEGELSFELMGAIPMNEDVQLTILDQGDQYHFSGDGLQTVSIPRTGSCEEGENYWLWPYFGGDETAPHSVKIQLKRETL